MTLCWRKNAELSIASQPSAVTGPNPNGKNWKLPRYRNATSSRREPKPNVKARTIPNSDNVFDGVFICEQGVA